MLAESRGARNPTPDARRAKVGFLPRFFADLAGMLKSGIGISSRLDLRSAAAEALESALQGLSDDPPEAAIVMATAAWGKRALSGLLDEIGGSLGCEVWAGASVEGVLVGDREISQRPALALLLLHGLDAEAFFCESLAGREAAAGAEILAGLPAPPRGDDLLLLFADSVNLDIPLLLAGLREELGVVSVVGVGASELAGDAPQVWARGRMAAGGCAGLWLRASPRPQIGVTQGVLALTAPFEVTRARGHWVLGLNGRPALEVLSESLDAPLDEFAARDLLVSVARDGGCAHGANAGAVIRNLIGFDSLRGSFGLAESVVSGDWLRLVRPDAEAARQHLASVLGHLGTGRAALGLYLNCHSRGQALFDRPGHEGDFIANALGGAPFLGVTAPLQFAPHPSAPGGALLHTHSGVVARFGR